MNGSLSSDGTMPFHSPWFPYDDGSRLRLWSNFHWEQPRKAAAQSLTKLAVTKAVHPRVDRGWCEEPLLQSRAIQQYTVCNSYKSHLLPNNARQKQRNRASKKLKNTQHKTNGFDSFILFYSKGWLAPCSSDLSYRCSLFSGGFINPNKCYRNTNH